MKTAILPSLILVAAILIRPLFADGPQGSEDTLANRISSIKFVDLQRLQGQPGYKIEVYSEAKAHELREKYAKYEPADIESNEIHKKLKTVKTSAEQSELYRQLSKVEEVRKAYQSHEPIYEVVHVGQDYLEFRRVDVLTPRITVIPFNKIIEVEFPPKLKAEREP